jgi:aspartyl-tRNA(Asn)/glutamyl-tRNA(Gln) amidotransferase subunit C
VSTSLDRGTVLRVARLARLRLVESEIDDYLQKLSTILEYVEQLKEVSTDGVEPMAHAVELNNVFREDVVVPSLPRELALSNAPKSDGKFFLVPQIIDSGS